MSPGGRTGKEVLVITDKGFTYPLLDDKSNDCNAQLRWVSTQMLTLGAFMLQSMVQWTYPRVTPLNPLGNPMIVDLVSYYNTGENSLKLAMSLPIAQLSGQWSKGA